MVDCGNPRLKSGKTEYFRVNSHPRILIEYEDFNYNINIDFSFSKLIMQLIHETILCFCSCINKTGLQPVSQPVEHLPFGFQNCKKGAKSCAAIHV